MEEHIGDAESEVDRIAHHYATAAQLSGEVGGLEHKDGLDVRERAVYWLGKALHHARAGELHLVAMRLCTQALEMVPPLEGAQRRRFLLGRARAATNLRDLDQAKADLDDAMGSAVESDDQQAVAEVLLERGDLEQKQGDLDSAAATLLDATERFRSVGDRRGEAESMRAYGLTQMFADNAPAATSSFTEALEIFRELGDRRGAAWALQNLAWVSYTGGNAELAERWLEESIAVFTEIGDSGGLGWATGLLAFVRYHQGRYDDAEALAQQMLVEAADRGDRWAEGMMRALLGLLALWTGRSEIAVEHTEKSLAVFRGMRDWYGELLAAGALGRALLSAGRVEEGFNVLHEAMSTASIVPVGAATNMAIGTLTTAAAQAGLPSRAPELPAGVTDDGKDLGWLDLRIARNMLQLQSGSTDGVRASMEAIVESIDGPSGYARTALTMARAADHDAEGALAAFRELTSQDSSTYSDRITAMVAAGTAAERTGDHSAADALLRTAQDLVDATEDRLLASVVRLALARVAEHRGDADADDALRRAHLSMSAMGVTQPGWDTFFQLVLT
jgi:tetratricopeptide (TPR) repeat protein